MPFLLINLGMTISIILFYLGYWFRFRNNRLHRIFNIAGMGFNLAAAIYLLTLKYLFGGMDAAGFIPVVDRLIIDIHRGVAAVTLVLMLLMGWSGITGKKDSIGNCTLFFYHYIQSYISRDYSSSDPEVKVEKGSRSE